jgi:hypothetical protein
LSDAEGKVCAMSANFADAGAGSVIAAGRTRAAETLKHFSAQPAREPQSLVLFCWQGCPCAQQSDCAAVKTTSGDLATTMPPATGSMATDIATRTTKMVRNVLMAQRQHYLLAPTGVK